MRAGIVMRILPLLLSALLLFAVPAWSEEVEAQAESIDPAEVAKLLLSGDEGERARGAALLRARVKRGGDVQTWLVAMARAQTEWADAEERLVERWIDDVLRGTPERAERARRLLAAVGRGATKRLLQVLKDVRGLLPQAPRQARQQGAEPPAPPSADRAVPQSAVPPPPREPQDPLPPVAAPVGRLRARVIEVPNAEIFGSLASDKSVYGANARDLLPLEHEQAVVVRARAVFRSAAALPEARVRPAASDRLLAPGARLVLVDGDPVRYRSRARKTKGAWAVDTATLRRGLRVSVRLETEGGSGVLAIEARYVSVPDPLPTERVRPAGDVEPLELDRPEWESASLTLRAPLEPSGAEIVAFFPGLVPEKVVVVGLRLLPLDPAPQRVAK